MASTNPRRRGGAAPAATGLFGEEVNVEAAPRADIDVQTKNSRRAKTWRRAVVAAIILGAVGSLAGLTYLPKALAGPPAQQAAGGLTTSPTKAAAILAVQSWLAQTPSPLPGGQFVSWDKVEIRQAYSVTTDTNNQPVEHDGLELHTMTVASGASVFTAQVLVGYSPTRGSHLIGIPTLLPQAPNDATAWTGLTSWPTLATGTKTSAMDTAAQVWVSAFTSGDPNQLRQATGDPSTDRSYVPLTGASSSSVQIEAVGVPKPSDPNRTAVDQHPSRVVARVSFALAWAGQPAPSGASLPRTAYDVLIDKADTGSPVIVAWGGVGTGESLQPYQNGIAGVQLSNGSTIATPQATPSAKPAPAAGTVAAPTPTGKK